MKKMRKTAVLVAMAAAVIVTSGCGNHIILDDDEGVWINAPGPWVDNWKKDNPNEADRYLWTVGVSDTMPSRANLQHARKSARADAIKGLVAKLGITVNTLKLTGEDWTNETRQLVIGTYAQSLETQMAQHDVNLDAYLWCGKDKEDTTVITGKSFVEHGLFRLDKNRLTESLAEDTAKDFEKNVKEHRELTQKAQKEAVDRAKELTKKWSDSLLSPKGE